MAHDFGVPGGCKNSREVIIKAWTIKSDDDYETNEDYETEKKVYSILSTSPMKGCPSLIESSMDPIRNICVLVLEKLGPSLEDLCDLMSSSKIRFSEQMTLALAIQMVRGVFLVNKLYLLLISYFFNKLDRYADLHARNIIHNGAKPGNICVAARTSDASTLYLIDFGCSFFCDKIRLVRGEEFSGNKRFWSALSFHAFSEFSLYIYI